MKKTINTLFVLGMCMIAYKGYSNYTSYPKQHVSIVHKHHDHRHTGRLPRGDAIELYCKYPGAKGMERPPTSGVGGSRYDLIDCCDIHEGRDCYDVDGKHFVPYQVDDYKVYKSKRKSNYTGPKYVDMEITTT